MRTLQAYAREFNPEEYLNLKIHKLHRALQANNRSVLIVGVSGGIDSAVVLGILKLLSDTYPNTYIIIPMLCPINESVGTTEQKEAYKLGEEVIAHFGMSENTYDLTRLSKATADVLSIDTPYIQQQMDYWLRPMAFYKMAMEWDNSIIVSTTNYSEWLTGWFSQYLDIFGIHPIIDIGKGRVYELATYFNIPSIITDTAPKGGLACAGTDEELLGFTYAELDDYLVRTQSPSYVNPNIFKRIEDSSFKRFRFNNDFIFHTAVYTKF